LQGRERHGRRTRQSRGVGGDASQGAQQQRQAGALGFALALGVFQGLGAFEFERLGALIPRRIALGAVGQVIPVLTHEARAGSARFARQAQFEGYAHAHGEEASVEQLEILKLVGGRLRPLSLRPERHAQPIGARAHVGKHFEARVGGVHENIYRTFDEIVKRPMILSRRWTEEVGA